MSQISVFNFRSTEVRTFVIDGEVWFVASDVAKALSYGLTTDMTRILDSDEKGMQIVHTPSGAQQMIIISESGMYHAVLKSRKPEAKPFRKWVTSDVLPAIRKTGSYQTAAVNSENSQKKIAKPEISDALQLHINRKTHEIALGQYDAIRCIITEAVQDNLNCGSTEARVHDYIESYGGLASEVMVMNKRDVFLLAHQTTSLLNNAGQALETIHRLEQHIGRQLYLRKEHGKSGCYGLPESLVESVINAAKNGMAASHA